MHGKVDLAFECVSISVSAIEAKPIGRLQGILDVGRLQGTLSAAAHVGPLDRTAENRGEGAPADRLLSLDDSRLPHRMPRRIDLQRDAWIGKNLGIFSKLDAQLQVGVTASWLSYSEP